MIQRTWQCMAVAAVVSLLVMGCSKSADTPTAASAPATQPMIAQTICPIMGNPINPEIFVEHDGRKVYFCCKPCVEKFKADPAKYLSKLDAQK